MGAKYVYVKKVERATKRLKKQLRKKFLDVKTKSEYRPHNFTIDKKK